MLNRQLEESLHLLLKLLLEKLKHKKQKMYLLNRHLEASLHLLLKLL